MPEVKQDSQFLIDSCSSSACSASPPITVSTTHVSNKGSHSAYSGEGSLSTNEVIESPMLSEDPVLPKMVGDSSGSVEDSSSAKVLSKEPPIFIEKVVSTKNGPSAMIEEMSKSAALDEYGTIPQITTNDALFAVNTDVPPNMSDESDMYTSFPESDSVTVDTSDESDISFSENDSMDTNLQKIPANKCIMLDNESTSTTEGKDTVVVSSTASSNNDSTADKHPKSPKANKFLNCEEPSRSQRFAQVNDTPRQSAGPFVRPWETGKPDSLTKTAIYYERKHYYGTANANSTANYSGYPYRASEYPINTTNCASTNYPAYLPSTHPTDLSRLNSIFSVPNSSTDALNIINGNATKPQLLTYQSPFVQQLEKPAAITTNDVQASGFSSTYSPNTTTRGITASDLPTYLPLLMPSVPNPPAIVKNGNWNYTCSASYLPSLNANKTEDEQTYMSSVLPSVAGVSDTNNNNPTSGGFAANGPGTMPAKDTPTNVSPLLSPIKFPAATPNVPGLSPQDGNSPLKSPCSPRSNKSAAPGFLPTSSNHASINSIPQPGTSIPSKENMFQSCTINPANMQDMLKQYEYSSYKAKDYTAINKLNPEATHILEDWYSKNRKDPYPDNSEVTMLAEQGGISRNQVRKWMANKRSRSNNTIRVNKSEKCKQGQKEFV